MANKQFNSRIIHKHDTSENWAKAINFTPKQGEIIVYDRDSTYSYERFKIGDGVTNINSLPFADDQKVDKTIFQQLVGDTSVAVQINNAMSTKQDILSAGHNITIENNVISTLDELPEIASVGYEWTQSNIPDKALYDAIYYNGSWMAAGSFGICNSIDGETWVQSDITFACYKFCCINDIIVLATRENGLLYSTDGITWTPSNITTGTFGTICYHNDILITGNNDGDGIYYSTDGMNWIQSNITNTRVFKSLDYDGNLFVAGSNEDNGIYYSTDGMTWHQSNITSGKVLFVYYANNMWLAGFYSVGLYYSTDGINWTISNLTEKSFNCAHYYDGMWVAGSYNRKGAYYSIDGMTWTQSNFNDANCVDVDCIDGLWVACNGPNGLLYSHDAITWQPTNITSGIFLYLQPFHDVWFASGNGTGVYYSKTSDIGKLLMVGNSGKWEITDAEQAKVNLGIQTPDGAIKANSIILPSTTVDSTNTSTITVDDNNLLLDNKALAYLSDINDHNTSTSSHSDIRTNISNLSNLVGDTAVSSQISNAIVNKVDNVGVITTGTGAAYTATVPSITELTVGVSFIMIPHVVSASTAPTLDVNGLGAKTLKRRLSNMATAKQVGYNNTWLAANMPFRVTYDGTDWIVEGQTKPAVADLYGLNATATELNYMKGVTSSVQDQLDAITAQLGDINTILESIVG